MANGRQFPGWRINLWCPVHGEGTGAVSRWREIADFGKGSCSCVWDEKFSGIAHMRWVEEMGRRKKTDG
jgi:hypothetical protein